MTARVRRAWLSIAAGLVLLAAPFVVPRADAAGEVGFLGYTFLADADAMTFTGGQRASQGYPQAASQSAHTEARVDTGPNATSLASAQWPGQFVGNVGSLFQVFGAPEEAGDLNYPVRAEASSNGTTRAEHVGALATAEGGEAESFSQVEGAGNDALFTFGDAESTSRSALEGAIGTSLATATVSDISMGDGVVTIDSVVTRAAASTDGETGTATGSAVVSGLEVAGQPARVDEDGVRFAGGANPNPVDAIKQQLIDEALANFSDGFTINIFMSKPATRSEGRLQEYRSGALVIVMTGGDPETSNGGDGTIAIGGSNAFVQASPGIPLPALPDLPAPSAPALDTPTVADPAPATGGPDLPTAEPTATPTTATTASGETAAPEFVPVSRFGGLAFAMPFFILAASLLIGRGLHQLHAAVVGAGPATACIDEGDPT